MPIHDRFQLLGPIYASNVFGAIARMIGPHLSVSRVADQNLHAAMPELSYAERCRIIHLVWENLGRTIGELPHLSKLDSTSSGPGYEISGAEHLCDFGAGPVIFVSAHIGNWEAFLLHNPSTTGLRYRRGTIRGNGYGSISAGRVT